MTGGPGNISYLSRMEVYERIKKQQRIGSSRGFVFRPRKPRLLRAPKAPRGRGAVRAVMPPIDSLSSQGLKTRENAVSGLSLFSLAKPWRLIDNVRGMGAGVGVLGVI